MSDCSGRGAGKGDNGVSKVLVAMMMVVEARVVVKVVRGGGNSVGDDVSEWWCSHGGEEVEVIVIVIVVRGSSHHTPRWSFIQWLVFKGRLSTTNKLGSWGISVDVSFTQMVLKQPPPLL